MPDLREHLPFRLFCLLSLVLFAGLAAGCASQRATQVKPLRTTILITDFKVPPEYKDPANVIKTGGWWFGAYRSFRNSNAGKQFADVLTLELRAQAGESVSLFDRLRLRQYFARKRTDLGNEFTTLSEEEIDRLIEQTPVQAFARDLGADKVLVGTIDSAMNQNSATRFFRSYVALQASLMDVDSGRVLWQYQDTEGSTLQSEMSLYESMARRMVRKMQQEYFSRQQ